MRKAIQCLSLAAGLVWGLWAQASAQPAAAEANSTVPAAAESPHRIHTMHLPNAIQVHPRLISGGLPVGDAAFAELQTLGVRTIISVDGAVPDVATARRFGLRYVHLPHGYDGVPATRGAELAKAVRELPGPIYIHCHHGKHRSPAAAAVACVVGGLLPPDAALTVLDLAGTDRRYLGLFAAAASARPASPAELAALAAEFPEVSPVSPLVAAMVDLERRLDRLRELAQRGWVIEPDSPPDQGTAAYEALLLWEACRELARSGAAAGKPTEFGRLLAAGEAEALALEKILSAWEQSGRGTPIPSSAAEHLHGVTQVCTQCHQQFRDNPAAR